MSDSRSLVRPVGLGVVLTVLLGVAGCGAADQAGGGDVAAFCDAYVEMRQASDTDQELASLSEQPETLFDDVEANAPPEVSEPVGAVVDATRQAAVDETPEAFMSRAFNDAANEVASYMFDNCEAFAKLDVTAVEYAFEGVPDTVTAGGIALRFTNEGDQFHEFILFRKNDGVTESFDEILALPEGQREELMTFAGAANREPGEPPIVSVFQAEAGEYIALCFVPVEGDGQPHFVEGQRAEFTVEQAEDLEWNPTLMSLKDRLRLWLDFSATAKDQNGTYYSWIISDYQLAARLNDLQLAGRPIRITKKMVDDTIATFEGILERAPLETRVATVRDLFERIDVDSRELKAVAVWNMTTDQGVNRSDAVGEWLRRGRIEPAAYRLTQGWQMTWRDVAWWRPARTSAQLSGH